MSRALSVCTVSGCGEPTADGRCDRHRHDADRQRGNRHARGYGNRWTRYAARYMVDHPLCVECGGIGQAVDHIDGEGPNGARGYDKTNLRTLCRPCHSRRTARDQPGGWNGRA